MKRLVPAVAFILGLLASLVWADRAFADKRVALVIGNSAYKNAPALPNPERDAKAMAAMFEKGGFAVVTTSYDAGNLQFKRAIRQFEDAAAGADIAVIYYAGHGIEINGTNYLVPVDAKLASDRDADDEAITLDRLVEAADGAKRLRLVILDACRDNPFVRTMKRQRTQTRGVTAGLGKVEPAGVNTLIAYAAKAGAPAEDGDGDHSPFTAALLNNLFVPGLDVRLAFGRTRDEVLTKTNNRQEPFVYGSLGGASISIVPAPSEPTAAPAVSGGEKGDYELVEKIGTKGAWEIFLAQHPKGFYASLARQHLAKLANVPPAAPKATQPSGSINIERREVAQPTSSTLRLALVIGNATYAGEKPLTASLRDASALTDELRRIGFDVTLTVNVNKQQMRSAIETFKNRIKPGATAVFFFAGYGIQTGKQSYLIPIDARIQTEDQVSADGFSVESILNDIHSAGATKKAVVIDAARANPFEPRFRDSPAGLAPLNAPPGTLAIYSASPDKIVEKASDSSLFVSELLKQIREPGLTAEEIFDYTRISVARASKREQVPRVWNTLNEDFLFAASTKVATRDLTTLELAMPRGMPEHKVALVIGNATYPDDAKPLPEPVLDAHYVADELRRYGFDLISDTDLTKDKMRAALAAFKAKIKPGSAALLFFSGHGIQTGKQSYLMPIDSQIWTESEIKRDGISVNSILSEMDAAGARLKLVVIDAARRNPFERRFRGFSAGLAPLNAPAGTLAIYSATPDKVASEGSDRGSVFVAELVKQMKTPQASAEDIFNRTRMDVARATRNEQVPAVFSSLTEKFYFTDGSNRPPTSPESSKTVAIPPVQTPPTLPERPKTVAIPPVQTPGSAASEAVKAAPPAQAAQPPQVPSAATKSARPLPPNTLLWWWPQWHR
jgi:uncharacterized caspase-like protein